MSEIVNASWEPVRRGWRYVIVRRVYDDGFCTGYVYARRDGRVLRFWTLTNAQGYAAGRNAEIPHD